jgi:phosphohistidine swiveling domain-containing protein
MELGNKYNNLKWLTQNKYNVPFFIGLSKADCQSDQIILQKTKKLNFPLAVRSSFAGEDGIKNSFAGLFDSILNVQTEQGLIEAVQKVSVSLKSTRVDEYCQYHGVTRPTWGSVIVQEMVQSKISGVIFTKDPMNKNNLIISSGFGLGENLVSGANDSDDISINILRPDFSQGQILNSMMQKKLFQAALKIESEKKYPQDIEWSIDEHDQIYFLQTRNITVHLNSENPIYFDNSNIQESFTGLTSPLTFTYAKNAYRHSYNTLMRVMGFSEKDIEKNDWRHQHMLGLVDGRVYYNINSWYEGLLFLPHFGRQKTDMEAMMGIETPIDFIQTSILSFKQKLYAFPKMFKLIVRLIYKFTFISKEVSNFDYQFQLMMKRHRSMVLPKKSLNELLNYLIEIQNQGFAMWGPPLINDFFVMTYSGKVRRALKSIDQEHLYPQMMNTNELESFKPVLMLNQIVFEISKDEKTVRILNSTENFIEYCKNNNVNLYNQLFKFIDLYGDRVLGELKLETQTFRTHPETLVHTLKLFLKSKNQNHIKSQIDVPEDIFSNFNIIKRIGFKINLKKLQSGIRHRELMRFHRTRSFGMIREIYLLISEKFVENQLISEVDDIFYLTTDEVSDIITYQSVQSNIQGIINLRKNEYANYEKKMKYKSQIQMTMPIRLIDKFEKNVDPLRINSNTMLGTGCYAGLVTAEVCYVKNISDAGDLSGKILLAERTDPGWTPLFYLACGVIVEKGSILSHAAIVAREVGIPIVIGVPKVTSNLKSGDIVTMNGATGEITIESRK